MDTKTADISRGDQRGASAVEYGLLIAGIAAVITIALYAFGVNVLGLFQTTCAAVVAQAGGTC